MKWVYGRSAFVRYVTTKFSYPLSSAGALARARTPLIIIIIIIMIILIILEPENEAPTVYAIIVKQKQSAMPKIN